MMPGIIALALLLLAPTRVAADETLWDLLRAGGRIVLMRHARTTPGVGDPPGFHLGDCPTQRNLTDAGRDEARRVGAAFRSRGIPGGRVLASQRSRGFEAARRAFRSAEAWTRCSRIAPTSPSARGRSRGSPARLLSTATWSS